MLRNAVKTSTGAPEVLGDLDEDILGKNVRRKKPAVERVVFESGSRYTGRDFGTKEQARSRQNQRQDRNRAFAGRGGKPYSKGIGSKPFTKKGSGM